MRGLRAQSEGAKERRGGRRRPHLPLTVQPIRDASQVAHLQNWEDKAVRSTLQRPPVTRDLRQAQKRAHLYCQGARKRAHLYCQGARKRAHLLSRCTEARTPLLSRCTEARTPIVKVLSNTHAHCQGAQKYAHVLSRCPSAHDHTCTHPQKHAHTHTQ